MLLPVTPENLVRAAEALRAGELVAFPTETVYGLGASALNVEAVASIFEAKGRPHFDPLIVHVADAGAASLYAQRFPPLAVALAEQFWPGPLTLVLPKRTRGGADVVIPDLVTAGLPTVALRVPAHPVALELLRLARVPVAAPSANRFGGVSPTTAQHVYEELGDQPAVILDAGPCTTGVESTVVSLVEPNKPTVLRLGGLPLEALSEAVGEISVARGVLDADEQNAQAQVGKLSPGMLDRHYAPRTPLHVIEAAGVWPPVEGARVGLLAFEPVSADVRERYAAVEVLSATGDLHEAAATLFAAMRRLDGANLTMIHAERVPDQGLGRAINDRLRRASTR